MNDRTFLFYDLETSGLSKSFDQVLEFAAIRTDLELKELKRHKIYIKLNPYTVPSPEAFITHQISPTKLQEFGVSELEGIQRIHELLNTPGTLSIGYNTLGFDDEFLRFSFYRNLLAPYTHQYANNCSRADLYPITVLYFLFKNDLLSWPKKDDLTTLKLEFLSSANDLSDGAAHSAMSDTEACLQLARRFIKERKMWDYALLYFDKNADLKRVNDQYALLLDGVFGAGNFYQCPVLNLGWHRHYKNQTLWLRLDQEALSTTTFDSIPTTTSIYRKKAGDLGLLLTLTSRFMRLSEERLKILEENKLWLQKNQKILEAISNYHREYKYPLVPNLDIDAALYQQGFASDHEDRWCQKFHKTDLRGKINLLNDVPPSNLRLRALRVLGRNFLEFLPEKLAQEFHHCLDETFSENEAKVDYRGMHRLTKEKAQQQIAEIRTRTDLSAKQLRILEEVEELLFPHILNKPKD